LAHLIRGVVAALVVAGIAAGFLRQRQVPVYPAAPSSPATLPLVDREDRARQQARWFVHMRWIAAGVTLALILIAVPITGILPSATLLPLILWWGLLVAANAFFRSWLRRGPNPERQIVVQALVDLVVLTGLLNASGGIENPLYVAYLFHVIIAGILLPRWKVLLITAAAITLFALLAFGEFFHLFPHYTNILFPHHNHPTQEVAPTSHDHAAPDPPPRSLDHAAEGAPHASHDPVFVAGRVVPFLAVLLLTAYLTTLVADRLRQSERQLERTARTAMLEHQRLESVVDAARVGMILLGEDQSVRWYSRRAAEWLDWNRHLEGQPCPLAGADGGCRSCLVARTFETGQPQEAERDATSSGGGLRYFRHTTSPVHDEEGRVIQVVELIEDITARKALEAEAVHAGKLSVLGRMAAGIAHEIGNPLSSLTTRLSLLERRPEPGFVQESMQVLRGQIDRIRRIVQGVSHFARLRREGWSAWELNALVEEAIGLLELDRRARGVTFVRRLPDSSPRVKGVRDQMSQVVLNLLLNAVEAMPEGGTVTVETLQQDREVCLVVADTGCGFDENVRAHLFEPFFTTKHQGTGLGLSISYSLVHAHGGRIEVEGTVGRGARFTVCLPPAEQPDQADSLRLGGQALQA
jgi:signal transduction histidine kinase